MSANTIIDVHLIQTVPFSNLNRDDTGSPKTGVYGGVTRARVSSQSQKSAVRKAFRDTMPADELGTRSKRWPKLLAEAIRAVDAGLSDETSLELAIEVLKAIGFGIDVPKPKPKPKAEEKDTSDGDEDATGPGEATTKYLAFFGAGQVQRLAQAAVDAHRSGERLDKKMLKQIADTDQAIDVALFGRMLADASDLNVDAASQVAHAVSVHGVEPEWDFYTAVDDQAADDNAGAGMMGTIEFNSSTLYRYASVNARALERSLGDTANAAQVAAAFVRAFATTLPGGKSNSFANFTLPEAVVVSVRADQPVNFAGAFETPVRASGESSRAVVTAERLAAYAQGVAVAYGSAPIETFVVRIGDEAAALDVLGSRTSLPELLAGVEQVVADRLAGTA